MTPYQFAKCRKYVISKLIFKKFSGGTASRPHPPGVSAPPSGPSVPPSALPGNIADL